MFSLANMGYDEIHCAFTPFSLGKLDMTCPYGTMKKIMHGGVGINAYNIKNRDLCTRHGAKEILDIYDARNATENNECTPFLSSFGIGFE